MHTNVSDTCQLGMNNTTLSNYKKMNVDNTNNSAPQPPQLRVCGVNNRISSYQRRIEDLQSAWELLHKIGNLQLQRMDGLKDEQFFSQFEKIVYEEIYQRDEEQFNECPLCGKFSSHGHSF